MSRAEGLPKTELAWGINSMPVNPAQGGNFGFAKLLSQSWFGTGILDVPVDGFKNSKNSRRMSMHFFVHTGKVSVVVADEDFIVSAGGSWHVPRGKSIPPCFYSSFHRPLSFPDPPARSLAPSVPPWRITIFSPEESVRKRLA